MGSAGSVERDYNELVRVLMEGQKKYIPYRKIRSQRNEPKWMTARLKHMIGMKRGIYKKKSKVGKCT